MLLPDRSRDGALACSGWRRLLAASVLLAATFGCTPAAAPGDESGAPPGDGSGDAAGSESGSESGDAAGEASPDRSDVEDAAPQVPPLLDGTDDLDETVVTIVTASGDEVRVDAKVAATDAERQRGLMQVPDLPEGIGMLFLFDGDRTGGFWMRDTLVPLDIAYIAADGRIGTILAMDPCTAEAASDCTVYTPSAPYRTALEVPQGWFASVGVAEGDTVRWTDPVPAPGDP